ncbi:MAG: DUF1449 family protein [Planctomycetes bacterium]|nr:DUF1449 family protein [Planctomycetota bacterium]
MDELLGRIFMWPSWPAAMMVIMACVYWLLVIAGAVTVDLLHIDFHHVHIDTDVDGSLLDLGFVPLRFLNLGRVPLMLWFSIFALSSLVISRLAATYFGKPEPHASFDFSRDALAIVRDFAVAALVTKVLTQPLRGIFDVIAPIGTADLIGKTCVIKTGEATENSGEARFATRGAPLLLTVRTTEGTLEKGELAEICDYSPDENIYFVKRANREERT